MITIEPVDLSFYRLHQKLRKFGRLPATRPCLWCKFFIFTFCGVWIEIQMIIFAWKKKVSGLGRLKLTDFRDFMASLKQWQTAFKSHTKEKTGILRAERFRDALHDVGFQVNNDVLSALILRHMRKDGTLRFGDFVSAVLHLTVAFGNLMTNCVLIPFKLTSLCWIRNIWQERPSPEWKCQAYTHRGNRNRNELWFHVIKLWLIFPFSGSNMHWPADLWFFRFLSFLFQVLCSHQLLKLLIITYTNRNKQIFILYIRLKECLAINKSPFLFGNETKSFSLNGRIGGQKVNELPECSFDTIVIFESQGFCY